MVKHTVSASRRHYGRLAAVRFRAVSLREYSQGTLSHSGSSLNNRTQCRRKHGSFHAPGLQTRPTCCNISSSPFATVGRIGHGCRLAFTSAMATPHPTQRAFIALGSNLGDRVTMIEEACREMEARGIKIRRTSSLFETAPMYVVDQGAFLNGACEVSG